MIVETIDNSDFLLSDGEYVNSHIVFTGADTLLRGTIIARNTSTGNHQIYVKGGTTNGDGVPVAILATDIVATGAGTYPCHLLLTGTVNTGKLIIDADGDASNVDFAVIDLLKDTGFICQSVREHGMGDNQ